MLAGGDVILDSLLHDLGWNAGYQVLVFPEGAASP